MKKYNYEGKTFNEAKEKALKEHNINEEDMLIKITEEKNTLLKKNVKIEVVLINDLINYIKETLTEILKLMDIEVNYEVRRRDDTITIKLFSNNNAILIGKNGRTISSLQTIVRQIVSKETNENIKIMLDVENYKEKRIKNVEYLAKKLAREVAKTKVDIKMDSMNSYERRVVHSILANDKYVYTESFGEEPNRCVVIKLKEEN